MDKNQVASILENIAVLLALKEGSSQFEVRAYENAARAINSLDGDIEQLVRAGNLKGTPGLGSTLIKRVEEMANTGQSPFYQELRTSKPPPKRDTLRSHDAGPNK